MSLSLLCFHLLRVSTVKKTPDYAAFAFLQWAKQSWHRAAPVCDFMPAWQNERRDTLHVGLGGQMPIPFYTNVRLGSDHLCCWPGAGTKVPVPLNNESKFISNYSWNHSVKPAEQKPILSTVKTWNQSEHSQFEKLVWPGLYSETPMYLQLWMVGTGESTCLEVGLHCIRWSWWTVQFSWNWAMSGAEMFDVPPHRGVTGFSEPQMNKCALQ